MLAISGDGTYSASTTKAVDRVDERTAANLLVPAIRAFNNTTYLYSATSGLWGRAPITALAQDVTAGAFYEIRTVYGRKYLCLKARTNFPVAEANIIATPNGYTWRNSGALDSADRNTTTANAENWNHGNTNTVDNTAAASAPRLYKTIAYVPGTVQDVICRVRSNADAATELAGIVIGTGSDPTRFFHRIAAGNNGGYVVSSQSLINGVGGTLTSANVASTATEIGTNGVWLRLQRCNITTQAFWSNANQATPPSSWTWVATATNIIQNLRDSLTVERYMQSGNTSNNFAADFLYYRDDYCYPGDPYTALDGFQPTWNAIPYDTSATAQQVFRLDLGYAGAPALPQALLRSWLQSRLNLLEPATTATATWALYQGDVDSPTYGAYATAASLTSATAGRYAYLSVKMLSDGTNPCSFLLD